MNYDMKTWLSDFFGNKPKKALPILSFPSVKILGVSVRELVSDSALQAKGMKTVADRTNAAAAVSFMDLSVEAECFGSTVVVSDDEVPTIKGSIVNDEEDAEALKVPAVGSGRSGIYIDAVRQAKNMIKDRPTLAGMIGPFSLAARLMDVSEAMMNCYDEPDMVHTVLRKTTDFLIEYAKEYKTAGADGIVLAEPVSGLLSPSLEAEFSSPYVKEITDAVQDDSFVLIYHNCGNNVPRMLDSILTTGAWAYHFGNAIDIKTDILDKVPSDVLVMGNVDPVGVLRDANPRNIQISFCPRDAIYRPRHRGRISTHSSRQEMNFTRNTNNNEGEGIRL